MRGGECRPVIQLHTLLKVGLILIQKKSRLGATRTTKHGGGHEGALSHCLGSPIECRHVADHIVELLLFERAAFLSES